MPNNYSNMVAKITARKGKELKEIEDAYMYSAEVDF